MSPRDYVSIAATLRLCLREDEPTTRLTVFMYNTGVHTATKMLADHFERHDHSFDRERFLEAAGYPANKQVLDNAR